METIAKAIETTGKIDKRHHLVLDKPLPISGPTKVNVIILIPENDDINEADWYKTASNNPSFNFLKDKNEDIYTINDGKAFRDPQ